MVLKLNLGCGSDIKRGYLNCDWSKEVGADRVVDLNKFPLPFRENSVDEILLYHIIEHFHEPIKFFEEFYRICKNGAIIKIRVPYFSHESAFSMLDHYHQFTLTSFDALDKNHACHWQSTGNFKVIKKELRARFSGKWSIFNLFQRFYQEYLCWIFPVKELYIELKVIK
jgi:ubiquinone/menaquinone biosynthesis C-methylase UbiE